MTVAQWRVPYLTEVTFALIKFVVLLLWLDLQTEMEGKGTSEGFCNHSLAVREISLINFNNLPLPTVGKQQKRGNCKS